MRRTNVRPFTQMKSNAAVELSSDFKLDLRDECTATAKLEKLKAKYQRATTGSQKAKTGF